MRAVLKDPDILKKKPRLRLMPNHFHYISQARVRFWNALKGPAVKDGYGWYKSKR